MHIGGEHSFFFNNQNVSSKFFPRDETYLLQTLSNIYINLKDTDSIAISRLRQKRQN